LAYNLNTVSITSKEPAHKECLKPDLGRRIAQYNASLRKRLENNRPSLYITALLDKTV